MSEPVVPVELLRGLAVLAEAPGAEHDRVARALGLARGPTASEYADLFLFQLYPYASVHVGAEGMMGGEARDRVGGFWRALGVAPPAEPDHLSALLGLYASLGEREGSSDGAERALTTQARYALLEEHLAPWVFAFLDRVREIGPAVYVEWGDLLGTVLRDEKLRGDEDPAPVAGPVWPGAAAGSRAEEGPSLPLHLRVAPGLPDPRAEGAAAFVAGLLSPVRSGVILTRSDLARLAAAAELGLRAGERRYALEHLLAQNAAAVLDGLATEVRRQRDRHRARLAWLDASATFAAERCTATLGLLASLADEARSGADADPVSGLGPDRDTVIREAPVA